MATLVIGLGTPGSANVISRSDGNDTKGPLDLARLKVSHAGRGHVFQLTTIGPFTNKDVNGKNGLFEIGIDTNADRRFNYYIDVFLAAGRFTRPFFSWGSVPLYPSDASATLTSPSRST